MNGAERRGRTEDPSLRFGVLGPLQAATDDGAVPLGVRRPHQVLAVLLAGSRLEASTARLLDEVWGRDPDRQGMDLLKNAVYQLNRMLDTHFGVRPIHNSGADGYLLDRTIVTVDAGVFEDLVSRVEQNRFTADATSIHGWAETAVRLWRGPIAFPGFDGLSVVEDYGRTLAAKLLSTQKIRFEAALTLGRHESILADLESLGREHPHDESLCSSLMLALARTGRQTDALRVYDDIQHRLVEGSGVDPSPDLKKLYLKILERHDTVIWRPDRATVVPPEAPTGAADQAPLHHDVVQLVRRPFVGRDSELDDLLAAVDTSVAPEPGLHIITGAPGMGKSRLVAALATQVASSGRTVLYGRCSPERSGALDPIADMLQNAADHQTVIGVTVTPRPPNRRTGLPDMDPAVELERRIQAAAEALLDRGPDRAPLLIIEDVQWIDPATLAVLDLVGREHPAAGVVLTCRPSALEPFAGESRKLAGWLDERAYRQLELQPLDDEAVRRLVSDVLPERHRHRASAVAGLVQRQARGIPMLVAEVVHAVEYEAAKRRPFSLAHIEAVAPSSLRGVVHRRLLRLSREARETLKAAAVAGPSFQLDVLSHVLGEAENALAAQLDECVAEALLTEAPGALGHYGFAHDLLREAVLTEVGVNWRGRLHHGFAAALDRLRGAANLRDQAIHLLGALPLGDATDAVRVTCEAARRSVHRFDVDDAIGLFHRALVAAEDHHVAADLRCDVLTSLAEVQSWSGEAVAAAATLEAAIELARLADDPSRFARAVLAPGTHHRVVFSSGARLELLREAADRLQVVKASAIGISIEANLLAESLVPGRYEKVGIDPDDLRQRAYAIGDPSSTLDALFAAHASARATPDIEDRAELSTEIINIAETSHDLTQQLCGGLTCQVLDLMSEGRFDAVLRTAERLGDVAERASITRYRWRSMVIRSALLRVRGEFQAADDLSAEALTIGHGFDRADADAVYGMQVHDSLRFAGASGVLRHALEDAAKHSSVTVGHLLFAHSLLADEDFFRAQTVWRAHRSLVIDLDPDELWLPTIALGAELVTTGIDDIEAANELLLLLEPFSGQWITVGIPVATWGPVDGYLGALSAVLDRPERARHLLVRAENQCKQSGAPMWHARMVTLRESVEEL